MRGAAEVYMEQNWAVSEPLSTASFPFRQMTYGETRKDLGSLGMSARRCHRNIIQKKTDFRVCGFWPEKMISYDITSWWRLGVSDRNGQRSSSYSTSRCSSYLWYQITAVSIRLPKLVVLLINLLFRIALEPLDKMRISIGKMNEAICHHLPSNPLYAMLIWDSDMACRSGYTSRSCHNLQDLILRQRAQLTGLWCLRNAAHRKIESKPGRLRRLLATSLSNLSSPSKIT